MKCIRCDKQKPPSRFYANDRSCKECRKALVRANRAANLEYYREFDRIRGRTPKHKKKVRDHYIKMIKDATWKADRWKEKVEWRDRNPGKYKAHSAVANAIRDGKLNKSPCEACGAIKVQAHHDDYSKPLKVRWLCSKHHGEHHRRA